MLPVLAMTKTHGEDVGALVDSDDLTRNVSDETVDDIVNAFSRRGTEQSQTSTSSAKQKNDDDDMKKSWRSIVDRIESLKSASNGGGGSNEEDLHAEMLIMTDVDDEARAETLLDLGEKVLIHTLGGVKISKIDINVVTSQPTTHATLNIYKRGVVLAARAYGIGGTPLYEVEDFIATRAASEFYMMLHRFYNSNVVSSGRLTVHLQHSGRTLEVERRGSITA